jgi:hypothetical protein
MVPSPSIISPRMSGFRVADGRAPLTLRADCAATGRLVRDFQYCLRHDFQPCLHGVQNSSIVICGALGGRGLLKVIGLPHQGLRRLMLKPIPPAP